MGRARIRPATSPGDLGWVVMAHGEVYARQFGWDVSFEALVARIVAGYATDHDPAREGGWIAELGGQRAGAVLCTAADEEGTAKLRTLLVTPEARGHGLGGALVETCVDFAREAGYRRMTLWTVEGLDSARRIYQANGFTLVDRAPVRSFGHDLIGQTWTRAL